MILIILFALAGFLLSVYLFSIEQKLKTDPQYRPACTINDRISCTKPLQSPYGKLFGFSNSILGIIFYPAIALLALLKHVELLFAASIGLIIFTGFLAYVLVAKVKAVCPICLAIYVINSGIFIVSFFGLEGLL